MAIVIKEIGKALNPSGKVSLSPTKYFYISEDTGEISRPFDTQGAAAEAVASLINVNDKTGETYYVVAVVSAMQSARKVEIDNYVQPKKK